MSHPHTVPLGWIKGEKLRAMGEGPRYALMQDMTVAEGFRRGVTEGGYTREATGSN